MRRSAAVVVLASSIACAPGTVDREQQARLRRTVRVSDGLIVRVGGGTVLETVPPTGPLDPAIVRVRAQRFDVRIDVEESGCQPRPLRFEVTHAGTVDRPSIVEWQAFLVRDGRDGELDITRTTDELVGSEEDPWTALAPMILQSAEDRPIRVDSARGVGWGATVDRGALTVHTGAGPIPPTIGACGAFIEAEDGVSEGHRPMVVRYDLTPPPANNEQIVRFAVWGNNAGHRKRREAFVAALTAAVDAGEEIQFVVVSGDLTAEGDDAELAEAIRALDALPVPWFGTVGDRDIAGDAADKVVARMGALTYALDLGPLRLGVLDSADASLGRAAFDRLEGMFATPDAPIAGATVPPTPTIRVAVTHYAPFDPYGLRGQAFKHRLEAARFVAALHRAEVQLLVTSNLATYEIRNIGDLTVVHSGGGGAPLIAESPIGHHWLVVIANGAEQRIQLCPRPLQGDAPACDVVELGD